jgi:RNA polymerase sigma-70 factor (ECF subfamily)
MTESEKLNRLINKCKAGQAEGFDELIELYGSRCFGFFYKLSNNRAIAEDLLSELFVKLVEKISTFAGGSFDHWLFTIATNLFKDYLRSRYRQQKLIETKAKDVRIETESERPDEMSYQLHQALNRLDSETAELIMMRFYADLSFKELAEKRKEPIGTTLCKIHRGLKKLREFMDIPAK